MQDEVLDQLAIDVGSALERRGAVLATAESCTGGWIAKLVTDVAGSSGWFDRGFVTYSNQAKRQMLGVNAETINAHGAVSEAVTAQMVRGALTRSGAGVAVAVSGIAGPGGGTPAKPVGTVCFSWGEAAGELHSATEHFTGDREAVRRAAVIFALRRVLDLVG